MIGEKFNGHDSKNNEGVSVLANSNGVEKSHMTSRFEFYLTLVTLRIY
jgi:hypothetical protein